MCNACTPILVGMASLVLELKFDETSLLSPSYTHSNVLHVHVLSCFLMYMYTALHLIFIRYLTTPSGIFLSYRGIQLVDGFDPNPCENFKQDLA